MIGMITPGLPMLPAVSAQSKDSPDKIKKAAQDFEALLIGQMLKAARESGGDLGTGEDAASQTGMELAEQQLAGLMASNGGLGLSKVIVSDLAKHRS